jgi:NAD(P)-dependent dehydrogenase (short-subunit alcohol dehydrogenase family)
VKNIVVSGGTDGMGRAIALHYLQGDARVVIVGRNAEKGLAFLRAAKDIGAGERAIFIQADLSLVRENNRVVALLQERLPRIDALLLCARHFRSRRHVTEEGFEDTFATFYLSRFVLGEALAPLLENADRPVILNLAGPGVPGGKVHWEDLGLERDYHGGVALEQGARLNDLLGVAFAKKHEGGRIKYVLLMPGLVSTSFSGDYDAAAAIQINEMKKAGKSIADAISPIIEKIDGPPKEGLSAFAEGRAVGLDDAAFDPSAALRLYEISRQLVSSTSNVDP